MARYPHAPTPPRSWAAERTGSPSRATAVGGFSPAEIRAYLHADMSGWLAREWERFGRTYDPEKGIAGTSPTAVAVTLSSMIGVFLSAAYVPPLAGLTGFRDAWVSIALTLGGGVVSTVAHRHGCRGRWGKLAILVDTSCYAGAVAWAAVNSNREAGYLFALVLAVMLIGLPVIAGS